jgi:hypothetical protein
MPPALLGNQSGKPESINRQRDCKGFPSLTKGKYMERNAVTFKAEYRAFGYIFAALVSLCTLPVLGWHYWQTLEGFALLGIGGLLLADCVLWFASHWAGRVQSPVLKVVTLGVKFSLAAVMIATAALCIVMLRSDKETESLARLVRESRTAEIEARAKAAQELTAAGNRQAAREILRTAESESVSTIAEQSRKGMESRVPAWLSTWGIYCLPPLCALVGALVLSIAATIAGQREEPRATSRQESAGTWNESSNGYGNGKPVMAWQGGHAITRPQ